MSRTKAGKKGKNREEGILFLEKTKKNAL